MSVNVNRDVTDAFYRYKMPKIIAKVEGKGNGIKTVIVNMVEVAKALSRPPTYPTKFFGCELGAQTQFDFKNERYIVNGSHDASKLQSLLDIFIKKFVLCPKCDNPETDLHPSERRGIIKQSCKACGNPGMYVDMKHKLTTFILKNPPDMKPDQQGRSLTKRKDRKKEEKNGQGNDHSDNSDEQNGVEEDDDEEWSTDVTQEAIDERLANLSSGIMGLTMSNDLEKSQSERLEIFYGYCKEKKDSGVLTPGATTDCFKKIAAEAERLDIKDGKAVMVLVELLLDENVIKQLSSQYTVLFQLFLYDNPKSQKYMMGALEKLIDKHRDALLEPEKKISSLFLVMYNKDMVSEEVFLEWGKKASKKYVSRETSEKILSKAKEFITWLQTAEEEDSSDDDDDIEIEYDDKVLAKSLRDQEAAQEEPKVAVAAPAHAPQEDSDDSDVDIDNL